ncbi:uncharacterized protein BDCG_07829 [Blastomyces dermatitidis ER-3]|uniref:Uncharacterized protein n=2 Tax=Ajellomyces dermatitidis TaxID=5039 RepID=F2TQW5_AJEDA|nr:uncharacterized protein BDCG_07829 [Blastomyces dermatitidis ER-3]EEQ92709.2 hypothetical protein BDCG_07829 [Blastomyces dermatitidis ER-3]EGE85628.2 hypothetical protein BDDG_08573 [Blastomyces dermatitidis ATCC 18188]
MPIAFVQGRSTHRFVVSAAILVVMRSFLPLVKINFKQVYAGVYPTDFAREAIRLKSTRQEYLLLSDKFNSSDDTIRLVPDLAISSASPRPFLVLEVGFSETYDDMLETAKIVLSESPATKFSVIIKIIEKPLFRPPLKLSDYL